MRQLGVLSLCFMLLCTGCATTLTKRSTIFNERSTTIKRIAVFPADVRVYEITAGGVTEEMDEWTKQAKIYINASFKKQISGNFKYELVFIDESELNSKYGPLWHRYKALYGAVAQSALKHAYPGFDKFESKLLNFDYTLGSGVNELSSIYGVDALLFVNGYDHEKSTGRVATEVTSTIFAALLGVSITYYCPTFLNLGLVDGNSGDILSFNINNAGVESSFRNEKSVSNLVSMLSNQLFSIKKDN